MVGKSYDMYACQEVVRYLCCQFTATTSPEAHLNRAKEEVNDALVIPAAGIQAAVGGWVGG